MGLDYCNQLPVPVIVQGEDKVLTIKLVSSSTGDPFDLTAASAITALLLNADSTVLELTLTSGVTIVNPSAGKIQVYITAAQSLLLALNPVITNPPFPPAPGGYQNLELRITIGGEITIVQLPQSVSVVAKLFPSV